MKVKISKKISETAAVFHGGIPESYAIYLDNCAALFWKKDLAIQHKGWKAEFTFASEDLALHLLDKPKADSEENDSNTSGDEAQSSNNEAKHAFKLI